MKHLITWINQNSNFLEDCVWHQNWCLAWHDLHPDPTLLLSRNAQSILTLESAAVAETKKDTWWNLFKGAPNPTLQTLNQTRDSVLTYDRSAGSRVNHGFTGSLLHIVENFDGGFRRFEKNLLVRRFRLGGHCSRVQLPLVSMLPTAFMQSVLHFLLKPGMNWFLDWSWEFKIFGHQRLDCILKQFFSVGVWNFGFRIMKVETFRGTGKLKTWFMVVMMMMLRGCCCIADSSCSPK